MPAVADFRHAPELSNPRLGTQGRRYVTMPPQGLVSRRTGQQLYATRSTS